MVLFGAELRWSDAAADQFLDTGAFALLIAVNGIGSGMFAAPNTSAIMGSVLPSSAGWCPGCGRRS